MAEVHFETLEEEATHATDEARMVLPGVQAILGFQLVAVFNQRFETLPQPQQFLHLGAFLLVAMAMGLLMTPAAYHRHAERGQVSRRFVSLASRLLSLAMLPLLIGLAIDTYVITDLVTNNLMLSAGIGGSVLIVLALLWFFLPFAARAEHPADPM